jgi:translin
LQLNDLNNSLKSVEKELLDVLGRREKLLKESRDVISSCSRAIICLHTKKFKEASKELHKAKKLLGEIRGDGKNLSRYLIPPEAEFVEASTLTAIIRGKAIPHISHLEVSPESYILGLLDSIGEIKRLLIDSIMRGDINKAKKFFTFMERLYASLSSFAIFDNIVNGTRRKIDVARILIEDTRGVLAEETRRQKLLSSMEGLYRSLETSRKV